MLGREKRVGGGVVRVSEGKNMGGCDEGSQIVS